MPPGSKTRSRPRPPAGEEEARRRAEDAQNERLGQRLSGKAAPAGSEHRPQGRLPRPARRPGQQHVRQIHAGDEQQDTDAGEEHPERAPGAVVSDPVARRLQVDADAGVVLGVLLLQLPRDGVQVGSGRRRRHPRLQSADHRQAEAHPPGLGVSHQRHEDVRRVEPGLAWRQDAHHGIALAVQGEGCADDVRVGSEVGAPEGIGEERHPGVAAGLVLAGGEGPSMNRRRAEHPKETGCKPRHHRGAPGIRRRSG